MGRRQSKAKGVFLPTLLGGAFLFLSVFVVTLAGLMNLVPMGQETIGGVTIEYGVKGALLCYIQVWTIEGLPHWVSFLTIGLNFLSLFLFLMNLVLSLIRKEPTRIVSSFVLSLGVSLLPYFFLLAVPLAEYGHMTFPSTLMISIGFALNIIGLVVLSVPTARLLRPIKAKEEPKPAEQTPAKNEPIITEREVRMIANELIHEHVLVRHKGVHAYTEPQEPKPAPVVEPKAEEKKKPEPKKEPEPQPKEDFAFGNGRRRPKFETRLRNSEYDIRHKYYDLRDYLKWYGLTNRLSIPGDTFTLRRERLAFITINGKHIKLYLALDPKKYEGGSIPVEAIDSKKFEDLPCALRVKSDLSYRRAKQLIDDLMAEKGIAKPEGPEPENTQEK